MYNVLVDAAGTVTCQSVIRGLRGAEGGVNNIITIDSDPVNAGRYLSDRFYVCPKADSGDYITFINELCTSEDIDIFIPIIDSGLLNVSAHLDQINDAVSVIVSPYDTVVRCDNKYKTSNMFMNSGLKTPRVYNKPSDVDKFPVFVRPLLGGRASLNCYKVDSREELDVIWKKIDEYLIITDYIEGQEYTIDCICDMYGNYIASLPRKRLETKSGVSYKAEVVHDEVLSKSVKTLTEKYQFLGPLNVQCIVDNNGDAWFIEINPRFSGTLAATIAAGLNTVEILLASMLGVEITPNMLSYNDGTFLRFWDDVYITK